MPIKSDRWIRKTAEAGMIKPFEQSQVKSGVISFGVSSYGYDFRISDEFQIPTKGKLLDPKNLNKNIFKVIKADSVVLESGSYLLGRSVEYFRIPRKILTICTGKSTYARVGVIVNVTPFEPEWEGFATLSIINASGSPVKIYANEGIAQLVFLEGDEECEISYADKKGKYQAQTKITHSKI